LFHGERNPEDLGAAEIQEFLSSLALERKVSAPTQTQALSALLFLYRKVLDIELPWLDGMVRAKKPARLPVVLSVAEVAAVLVELNGVYWLVASLLYGSGLRHGVPETAHPHDSGIARPQRRKDDDDLYARGRPRRDRHRQSPRRAGI
jgi:site-specific recombinase XerD